MTASITPSTTTRRPSATTRPLRTRRGRERWPSSSSTSASRAARAKHPADVFDHAVDEGIVHAAGGDECTKVDRPGREGEHFLAVDLGGEFAARDRSIEHRFELAHAPVEEGARDFVARLCL